jgi:DNA-binding NtrC family response regulator
MLAEHFIGVYSKKYRKKIKGINAEAMKKLLQYQWPGNVRELQHAIERAIIMSDSDTLQPDDFMLSSRKDKVGELELDTYNLNNIEKTVIEKVLKQNQGNVSQAASMLGLTRTSLYRRMEKYGL